MLTVTFVCLIVAAFGIYSIKRPVVLPAVQAFRSQLSDIPF